MAEKQFLQCAEIPASREALWRWHTRPGAFERLSPPWENVQLASGDITIADGEQATIELRKHGVKQKWVAEHFDVAPGAQFRDRQLAGPFAFWEHLHRFDAGASPHQSMLVDEIRYRLPVSPLSDWVAGSYARKQLEAMFAYRHWVTAGDLARFGRWFAEDPPPPRRVLITGMSGLIGTALRPLLRSLGWEVRGLSRQADPSTNTFAWDPERGELDLAALQGVDIVIHLAGANIAGGRWTPDRRKLLRESRERPTRLLAEKLAAHVPPAAAFISMSGASCYPFGPEAHTEDGPLGDSFLAEVVQAWETATRLAASAGWRTVHLRTGMVLTPRGGALAKMLPAFNLGAGGPVGSGEQHWSWIGLHDLLDLIITAATDSSYRGAVNAVAPQSVSSREFGQTLGKVLRRPAFAPLSTPVVKALFGSMGNETLLADNRVVPAKLQEQGFRYRTPELETCFRVLLGRPPLPDDS